MNPLEIILILAVALIVIGPERMPEVMRAVGKVLRELRVASNTVLHELTDGLDEPAPKARPPAPTNGQSGPPPVPPSEKA